MTEYTSINDTQPFDSVENRLRHWLDANFNLCGHKLGETIYLEVEDSWKGGHPGTMQAALELVEQYEQLRGETAPAFELASPSKLHNLAAG